MKIMKINRRLIDQFVTYRGYGHLNNCNIYNKDEI